MVSLLTFDQLVTEANKQNLYGKLIHQLNKDLLLANIDLEFSSDILPSSLKLLLHESMYKLIQDKFTEYLNLLYIIDVPETVVKSLDGEDLLKLAEDVAFLILNREWQKVWYRQQYS